VDQEEVTTFFFFCLYNRETLLFGVWLLVEHSTEDFENCVRQRFSRQVKVSGESEEM